MDAELLSTWGKAAGTFLGGAIIVLAGYKWPKFFHKEEPAPSEPSRLPSALALAPNEVALLRDSIKRVEDIASHTFDRVNDLCDETERNGRNIRSMRDEARDYFDNRNRPEKPQ